MSNGGYILLARCLLDSPLWKSRPEDLKIALYCLLRANWKTAHIYDGASAVTIHRGSLWTSLDSIAQDVGVSVKTVRTALTKLSHPPFDFLASKPARRGRIITISNYETYQDADLYSGKQNGKLSAGTGQAGGKDRRRNKQLGRRIKNIKPGDVFDFETLEEAVTAFVEEHGWSRASSRAAAIVEWRSVLHEAEDEDALIAALKYIGISDPMIPRCLDHPVERIIEGAYRIDRESSSPPGVLIDYLTSLQGG